MFKLCDIIGEIGEYCINCHTFTEYKNLKKINKYWYQVITTRYNKFFDNPMVFKANNKNRELYLHSNNFYEKIVDFSSEKILTSVEHLKYLFDNAHNLICFKIFDKYIIKLIILQNGEIDNNVIQSLSGRLFENRFEHNQDQYKIINTHLSNQFVLYYNNIRCRFVDDCTKNKTLQKCFWIIVNLYKIAQECEKKPLGLVYGTIENILSKINTETYDYLWQCLKCKRILHIQIPENFIVTIQKMNQFLVSDKLLTHCDFSMSFNENLIESFVEYVILAIYNTTKNINISEFNETHYHCIINTMIYTHFGKFKHEIYIFDNPAQPIIDIILTIFSSNEKLGFKIHCILKYLFVNNVITNMLLT